MGIRHYTRFAIALVLVAIALPRCLQAQVLYGSITGNVTDKAGLAMPSAKIELLDTGTGTSEAVRSR